MTDLLALAERVEAATEASREIDCLVHETRRPDLTPAMRGSYYGEFTGDYFGETERGFDVIGKAPRFTASLDAAMTLVPEGWHLNELRQEWQTGWWSAHFAKLPSESQQRAYERGGTIMMIDAKGSAATPALALTAACLRARAACDSGRLPKGENAERSGAVECEASQSGDAASGASPKVSP